MDKTKRLYTQLEEQVTSDPEVERWLEARHEFFVMSPDDKLRWKRRVESRYPRLDRLAES